MNILDKIIIDCQKYTVEHNGISPKLYVSKPIFDKIEGMENNDLKKLDGYNSIYIWNGLLTEVNFFPWDTYFIA